VSARRVIDTAAHLIGHRLGGRNRHRRQRLVRATHLDDAPPKWLSLSRLSGLLLRGERRCRRRLSGSRGSRGLSGGAGCTQLADSVSRALWHILLAWREERRARGHLWRGRKHRRIGRGDNILPVLWRQGARRRALWRLGRGRLVLGSRRRSGRGSVGLCCRLAATGRLHAPHSLSQIVGLTRDNIGLGNIAGQVLLRERRLSRR
jgi:hypothetical protein